MTTTTRPATAAEIIASAERLIPFLREQAAAIEEARRLTPEVAQVLRDNGLFRMTMPPPYGISEDGTLASVMLVLETLARGDASVAWSTWATLGIPAMSAFFPEEGLAEMMAADDACLAGSEAAMGRAVPVEGGYRVSGRWPFASGITQATYVGGMCLVFEGEQMRTAPDGQPIPIVAVFPVSEVTVHDTWHSTGLRGTASNDYSVEDVFVPSARVADFALPPRPGLPAVNYINPDNAANVTLAAMALGVAAHCIEAFRDLAPTKQMRYGGILADAPHAKTARARAEVQLAQARGYLYETADKVWEALTSGNLDGTPFLAQTSLASTAAMDAAVGIVSSLYRAAGSSAVYSRHAFDRCLRDIYTMSAHKTVQQVNYLVHGDAVLNQG